MLMKLNKMSPPEIYSWMGKYPKNSKTIPDLQNSLFIHRNVCWFKNDHAFQKLIVKSNIMFVKSKNDCEFKNCSDNFQINVHRF